jgi:DNA-3-methyladenine glycosylase II
MATDKTGTMSASSLAGRQSGKSGRGPAGADRKCAVSPDTPAVGPKLDPATSTHDNPAYDVALALRTLKRRDKVLASLIRRVPFSLTPNGQPDVFGTLAHAIVSQQLSGKAAATIFARFQHLFGLAGNTAFAPSPQQVLAMPTDSLRSVGLSQAKTHAIKDLADKIEQRQVLPLETLMRLDDEAIIDNLIQVRGIGRWTAEMFLMFQLGRPDVLPVDDLGVRKGFMLAYDLADMPSRSQLVDHAERWRPWRSIASWYMWRAVELHRS